MNDTLTETPDPKPGGATRTAWWIVGGTITGVVLLLAMAATGVWIWTVSSPEETDSHTEEYTRAVADINVDLDVGDVHLTAAETFEVRRDMTWRGSEPDARESWSDADSFTATASCTDNVIAFADECDVDYAMSVPSGTDAEVRTSVKDIHVDGLDAELDLRTSVGDIEAENLRSTDTYAEANVGDVVLSFAEVRGDITVDTDTGNVTILVPDDGTTYDVWFESGVGSQNVDIATDPSVEAGHLIRVSTGVGDLDVRYVS